MKRQYKISFQNCKITVTKIKIFFFKNQNFMIDNSVKKSVIFFFFFFD